MPTNQQEPMKTQPHDLGQQNVGTLSQDKSQRSLGVAEWAMQTYPGLTKEEVEKLLDEYDA